MNAQADLQIHTDLDEEIEGLFQDLDEADAVDELVVPDTPGLTETLHQQEQRMDAYRVHLVDFTRQMSSFVGASLSGGFRAVEASVGRVIERLSVLHELAEHDGKILLRHRGRGLYGEGPGSAAYDYIICFGALNLDIPLLKASELRLGKNAAHATLDFKNALKTMGSYGINTLHASTLPHDPQAKANLRLCLNVLSDYLRISQAGKSIKQEGGDPWQGLPVVLDQAGDPDPNLTCLAAVNGLKPKTVTKLVKKISSITLDAGSSHPLQQYAGVYDAIFGFEKLRDVLTKPPMEINNARWLVSTHENQALSGHQAKLVRFLSKEFPNGSQAPGRIADCLYATDFGCVNAVHLLDRLSLASDLLWALSQSAPAKKDRADFSMEAMEMEVLGNLEAGLSRVSDSVFNDLAVAREELVAKTIGGDLASSRVDDRILDLVSFFRHRSHTKRKMRSIAKSAGTFDDSDHMTIARDFDVTVDDARELVSILKKCFSSDGHFIRPAFEENIPAFARHQNHVFEFLWHYLKNSMHKDDRIAFLNALQLLIDKMNQPQKALSVLLEDFIHDPATVKLHDRNALMLCNVLVRTFNKELHTDIEYTPQEVLRVREGLDEKALAHARKFIDSNRERFFLKMRTIHSMLKKAIDRQAGPDFPPTRYLLILEWEIYILFSLVGGETSQIVVASALGEYGNPDAEIYHLSRSKRALSWLLLILQVAARGAARSGRASDLALLNQIKEKLDSFIALGGDARTRKQIINLGKWLDKEF